ncbi:peptidylprolyl isomerase [Parvularcula lutaonensis]|uniref:Parvulin-like PPIase n=1 Tax=Parvularcula lutaonensis TaxID=491923 RepID=A0ABV7MD44_9PROT
MEHKTPSTKRVGAKASWGFQAKAAAAALSGFGPRAALHGVFAAVLVCTAAAEAIRLGVVERPMTLMTAYTDVDPVVAKVGREVLRVSDAVAHAQFIGDDVENAAVPQLIASGTVDDAADHLALAQLAREQGLDGALEIRAAVALAERQILAEAFLDRVVSAAVTEDAIRARYEAEKAALEQDSILRLSKIVVATEEEALAIADRLPRSTFSSLAASKSLDEATAEKGGLMGDVRLSELPEELAAAVAELPIGGHTAPIATDDGYTILKLESRRAQRLAPFSERHDAIAATLRDEAIASAIAAAREKAPARIRAAEAIMADEAQVSGGTLATVRRL